MDAIVLLRNDHKTVEGMFKTLQKDDLTVVPDICAALSVHARLEEEIFYPAVKEQVQGVEGDVGEAVEEHHLVTILVDELANMSPDDAAYGSKATVLMELVRHHVEEEEKELFPEVRSGLGRSRLQDLGNQMLKLKNSLER